MSKTRYFLIELVANLLFFALSISVCLALFANGSENNNYNDTLSNATIQAQKVAEIVKAYGYDDVMTALNATGTNEKMYLYYDENWSPSENESVYTITIEQNKDKSMLNTNIIISNANDELIYDLSVAEYGG